MLNFDKVLLVSTHYRVMRPSHSLPIHLSHGDHAWSILLGELERNHAGLVWQSWISVQGRAHPDVY